jgi:pimeloyl-ACP methyl ester carboxylesterase
MQVFEKKFRISIVIYIILAIYIVSCWIILPITLTSSVLGRVETLDRVYDPPTGTPQPPTSFSVKTKDDVILSGWMFPVSTPKAWIIVLPDPYRNRSSMMPLIRWFTKNDYGVVAMDLRARGESKGRFLTGGIIEARDLLLTANRLQNQIESQTPIMVYGVSLGAVAALVAASQSDAFEAIIADSPFPSTAGWFHSEAKRQGWLHFPGLFTAARLWAPVITGFRESTSNLKLTKIAGSIRAPVLFLTGETDPNLTDQDVLALRSAIPVTTKAETFPTGYGGAMYALNRDAYQTALSEFLTKITAPKVK